MTKEEFKNIGKKCVGESYKKILKGAEKMKVCCSKCGGKNFKKENIYYEEWGEVEFGIACADCNTKLGYFAYGSIEWYADITTNVNVDDLFDE